MARVSRVSPRYNDRILHDDEEKKSEIGKGYREGIIFLFFYWIYFQTFVTFVIVLSNQKVIIDSHGIGW